MEALTLPVSNPHFTIRHTLDGREYVLTFEWSERESAWYVSLADQADSPISGAVRVCADWPLFLTCNDDRKFTGALLASDVTGQGVDPTLEDFGARVLLVYVPAGELA